MRKGINKNINGFLSNSRTNITRFNYSGIITNNQHYLTAIDSYSWEPPSDWLRLPDLTANDQRFTGLMAIIQGASGNTGSSADSNFVALLCQGNYIVDWGNGVTTAHASNTVAQYQYNFANIPNSTLTTDGFKQVIIQAYPQAGATLTVVDINRKFTVTGVTLSTSYVSGWLDIKIAGRNISTLTISTASRNVLHTMLKRFEFVGPSSITNLGNNFLADCYSLEKVLGQQFTANNTNFFRAFNNCYSLSYIDLLDTRNATNMEFMCNACYALETFPPLHLGKVTGVAAQYLVNNCVSLKNFPYVDTSQLTSLDLFFGGCVALKRVPDLPTPNVTAFTSTFNGCSSLEELPNFDTSKATSYFGFCLNTYSLKKIPPLNYSAVTSVFQAFMRSGIYEFPAADMSNVTDARQMLYQCPNLTRVNGITFGPLTNALNFFYQNSNLIYAGPFNFSRGTTGSTAAGAGIFNGFFVQTSALSNLQFTGLQKSIDISNQVLSAANLNYLFDNLVDVTGTGATITITNNWGVAACDRTKATGKGWTVVG